MDLVMVEENNLVEETDFSEDSSDVEFACGDPQVDPRVGDEYQVEIPRLMSASKRAVFLSNPVALDDSSYSFLVGRPVEVMWIDSNPDKHRKGKGNRDDNVDMNESLRSLKAKRSRCSAKIRSESNQNSESRTGKKQKLILEAVPAIPFTSWEDLEVASFVLGLYTFGKNFAQVKRFVGSKGTGDILLFYYGKFYHSAKYHSWSDSRKKRNRKCVYGRKLYSGWRQQLLLSRLIPSISDESQKQRLVNVSKSFAEGSMSLEIYVTEVKDLVGLRLLVDAVAIGKEKEDLTVVTTEPVKTKSWFTVSPKFSAVPSLGAYASLTSVDIINQLTGGLRLSKARCNDIFWEAVWPRLLARGWHSEQPKDRGYVTSKDYLVFLVPGVKRFSRRKLVKGDQYFDSVSDILTKVASEPELLEFEAGENRAPNGFIAENSSDQSDRECSSSNVQRHRYLMSPCSNRGNLRMKFTVVDTSFPAGGKLCDLREPRTLNAESLVSEPMATLGDNDSSVLKKSLDSHKVERSRMKPLDVKKHAEGGGERRQERRHIKNLVDDSMRFTIIDTSLDHRGQSSGLRRQRHLPGDEKHSELHKGMFREAFGDASGGRENTKRGMNAVERNAVADSCIKEEEEETLEEKVEDPSKKLIKHKFTRRAETKHQSVNSGPLLKRRRLSACVRREENSSGKSLVFKPPEPQDLSICSPKITREFQHGNSTREMMIVKDEERYETVLSLEYKKPKSDESEKTGTGISSQADQIQETSQIEPNGLHSISGVEKHCSPTETRTVHELRSSEQQKPNGFCSILNCPSKETGTFQEHISSEQEPNRFSTVPELDEKEQPVQCPTISDSSNSYHHPSNDLGTSQDQEMNTDGPRRLSTRKRPLTTRALEAMEYGFLISSKRMKSSIIPRKRESPRKKKQSAKVCNNRTQVLADNIVSAELENGGDKSSQVKKATSSKPLDQIEDSKPLITEYPKLPPIVLKLPLKRA